MTIKTFLKSFILPTIMDNPTIYHLGKGARYSLDMVDLAVSYIMVDLGSLLHPHQIQGPTNVSMKTINITENNGPLDYDWRLYNFEGSQIMVEHVGRRELKIAVHNPTGEALKTIEEVIRKHSGKYNVKTPLIPA